MGCGYSVYSDSDDIIFKYKGPPRGSGRAYKMFKKENGLLFRIEMNGGRWAFYNDTKEYEFHLRYVFDEGSDVTGLGDTTVTEMDDGTTVVETVVYPLETLMFVEGDIAGGRGRIEAMPVSGRYKREKVKGKLVHGR